MNRSFQIFLVIFLTIFLANLPQVYSQDYKVFETEYSRIHYQEDAHLRDFLWKTGGIKLGQDFEDLLAANRIDRLIARVESILHMYPDNFHLDIFVYSGYKSGLIAFYSEKTMAVTVFVERVTDGVLAHEIAHAVMHAYFRTSPSRKVQEILCQYVDSHLWGDYY